MSIEGKFVHDPEVYNLSSPKVVVPILWDLFQLKSVLDVGCGIGTWLRTFLDLGVPEVLGLDGDYVDRNLLKKYIKEEQFKAIDLTHPFSLNKKFDLVISLEVAEHLPETSAQKFIESLVLHGDIIVFSAAIPGQGGQNHINEQWKEYWINKFSTFGYMAFDLIRPRIWNNANVDWWYKQNLLVFSKRDLSHLKANNDSILEIIHPHLFKQNQDYIIYLQQYLNELETKLYLPS